MSRYYTAENAASDKVWHAAADYVERVGGKQAILRSREELDAFKEFIRNFARENKAVRIALDVDAWVERYLR